MVRAAQAQISRPARAVAIPATVYLRLRLSPVTSVCVSPLHLRPRALSRSPSRTYVSREREVSVQSRFMPAGARVVYRARSRPHTREAHRG